MLRMQLDHLRLTMEGRLTVLTPLVLLNTKDAIGEIGSLWRLCRVRLATA